MDDVIQCRVMRCSSLSVLERKPKANWSQSDGCCILTQGGIFGVDLSKSDNMVDLSIEQYGLCT